MDAAPVEYPRRAEQRHRSNGQTYRASQDGDRTRQHCHALGNAGQNQQQGAKRRGQGNARQYPPLHRRVERNKRIGQRHYLIGKRHKPVKHGCQRGRESVAKFLAQDLYIPLQLFHVEANFVDALRLRQKRLVCFARDVLHRVQLFGVLVRPLAGHEHGELQTLDTGVQVGDGRVGVLGVLGNFEERVTKPLLLYHCLRALIAHFGDRLGHGSVGGQERLLCTAQLGGDFAGAADDACARGHDRKQFLLRNAEVLAHQRHALHRRSQFRQRRLPKLHRFQAQVRDVLHCLRRRVAPSLGDGGCHLDCVGD